MLSNLSPSREACEAVFCDFGDRVEAEQARRWAASLDMAFDWGVMTLGANQAGIDGPLSVKTERSFDAALNVARGAAQQEAKC